jgi:predicted DNA-binding transcriptional regulator YafY
MARARAWPVARLAALRSVHQRTIRRDHDALCRAGFPLYDEKVNGTSMWKLRAKPFARLEETGLRVAELCVLYFSRTMLSTLAGAPFHTLALLDEHFTPRPLPREPFANSLGVHSGSPEPIEIDFDADAADYIREREWHPSQTLLTLPDGGVRLRLCVCNDRDLRRWILGFGRSARVVSPAGLARGNLISPSTPASTSHVGTRSRGSPTSMKIEYDRRSA